MKAVAAVDLIDGQVVRLLKGEYAEQTTYDRNPVEYARQLEFSGLDRLHLVDLSGAKISKLVHTNVLHEITEATDLKVDFGGGIQTEDDVETILNAGASQVVIGSLCAQNPELVCEWINRFGAEKFILALDTNGQEIRIKGWQESSGKTLDEVLSNFRDFAPLSVLTTDIRRDGTGTGPSVELYADLVNRYPKFRWIASGGVENLGDLEQLRTIGCAECVVGKALLDGKITPNELKLFNDGRL